MLCHRVPGASCEPANRHMVTEVPSRPLVPPSVIPDQHQGSKSDFGGEVDIEEAIDRHSCSFDYYKLEECLGEHDRDWRKCQVQVNSVFVAVICC